ncbi:MAG: GNAT family N-acetyltransferase [Candidatus Roizmanbacteria bacterium]|nr:GNAT family N-acetyltransferase [Candidatus Roizmanbacteria bacterium]
MLVIRKTKLSKKNISELVSEIKHFKHLTYFGNKTWQSFDTIYGAYVDNELAGVLAVNHCLQWGKIGPLVVLSRFQNQKIASKLVAHVINQEKCKLYLASANPAVWKIVSTHAFRSLSQWFKLPIEIYFIYLKLIVTMILNRELLFLIAELKRKKTVVHNHRHFVLLR